MNRRSFFQSILVAIGSTAVGKGASRYIPALRTGTPNLVSIYYRNKGLALLQKKFQFTAMDANLPMPLSQGKKLQWFRYATTVPLDSVPSVPKE